MRAFTALYQRDPKDLRGCYGVLTVDWVSMAKSNK